MKPVYSLLKDGGKFVVREFLKGEIVDISPDEYVSRGNDIRELFRKYLNDHPKRADDLRFEDSRPGFCDIVCDGAVLEEISVDDIKAKVEGKEKFLETVDYSRIVLNTKLDEEEKRKQKAEASLLNRAAKLKEAVADKNFLRNHKGFAAAVTVAILLISICLGQMIMTGSDSGGYAAKDYNNGTIDRKLKGMEASLREFGKKHKTDPELAMLDIEEIIWFDKRIDKEKLSDRQKNTLETLHEKAEAYQARLEEAKGTSQ